MANPLKFGTTKKKKIEAVRNQKTRDCRLICICSLTSTIHILVPMLKVLNRLGTVQVISEDKSVMLLSKELESEFELGDINVMVTEDIVMLDDDVMHSIKEYDYSILITQDFLPELNFDKYIMLNRRHHFRDQIQSAQKRYTPIFSVFNQKGLKKEIIEQEKERIYVNERLVELPSFAITEDYLSSLMIGQVEHDYKVNTKITNFIIETLNGIEGCQKSHIRSILLERGELFVSPN